MSKHSSAQKHVETELSGGFSFLGNGTSRNGNFAALNRHSFEKEDLIFLFENLVWNEKDDILTSTVFSEKFEEYYFFSLIRISNIYV